MEVTFESMDRMEILRTLNEMEVPDNFKNTFGSTYRTVRAKVHISRQRSEEFKMNKEKKQGDSLDPLLSIIEMDKNIK